jgi:hypothetical protein
MNTSPNTGPSPGPAKEGVVLDREGHTIYTPDSGPRSGTRAQVRVYRGGWWLPIALGLGIPILFVAGIFVFTLLMTIGILVWFLRAFFGGNRRV